jgi:hypothetical protein
MKTSNEWLADTLVETIGVAIGLSAAVIPVVAALGTALSFPRWVIAAAGVVAACIGAVTGYSASQDKERRRQELERKIESAETKAEAEPARVKFAWEAARIKLEAYFDRNLSQVKAIFVVSVVVMVIGFGLMAYAVVISLTHPQSSAAYVSAICGIITEFIGATFMAIYRSTIAQASSFTTILERINTVGMAVQILDSIPDEEVELKNRTRSEIVKLLLAANRDSFRPSTNQGGITKRK